MRFPLSADGFDVIHFDRDVLHALAVFFDKLVDLGFHGLVPALHERDLCVPALDDHRIHAGFVASDILRRPDDFEPKNLS